MESFFETLWKVVPQLMSVVFIIGILFFCAFKVSQLYHTFEHMNDRLTKLETKVDSIIEFLMSKFGK